MSVRSCVFDAYALIAFFEGESGAAQVEQWLADAVRGDAMISMAVVNLGEIWYAIARAYSAAEADAKIDEIFGLPISITDADWPLTRQAAAFKRRGRISYADCFAAALCRRHDAVLLTGDREFEQLEDEISIEWL